MFLYLKIRMSSRNPSTDFPTVIYVYYHGNWLHVSLLGNSSISILKHPSTDFPTRDIRCIILEIDYMFIYLEIRISSRNSSNWFHYCDLPDIIMEIDYMFLNSEISISSRNTSTDFPTVIYVYYHGYSLNVTVLGNTHIISKTVDWFLYSEMCLLSWQLNTFLLYLEIRISSRNPSTDFPTVIYVYYHGNWLTCFSTWKFAYLLGILPTYFPTVIYLYYHGNWLHVSLLGNSHIYLGILITDFPTVIYVYYLGNWLHVSLLGNSHIFYVILPPISLLWYTYIIIEIDYHIFSTWKFAVLSRNISIDYHTLECVYYHGNWLHFTLLGNTYITSYSVYRFIYSWKRIISWKLHVSLLGNTHIF